jgi:hypothetical protein
MGQQSAPTRPQQSGGNNIRFNNMHADTCAALRLLAVTLTLHPEDAEILGVYGDLPDHLADAIDDYLDDDDVEVEE